MKKTQTWIITCFYLQLLLLSPLARAQGRCGNPVTDDVNDITKLPNHCWLHLMVPEFSNSLNNLLQKFSDMSDVLSNYSIINNLTRIILDIMSCLDSEKKKDFRKENGHLYEEGRFIPEEFFRYYNRTIDAYKDFAEMSDHSDCVLPSTTETPENNPRVTVTKPFLLPPVAASSLRNDSSDNNKEVFDFTNSPSLKGISIAVVSLFSLLIGFTLGAICWKKTHRKPRPESDETQCNNCQEENEISMLQQKEKELLQV
ncbi:kit ligand isoform X2 [Carettochelys insculpta]|uniref:kit ligand isoform X2 n=1 Tax=Carettochelys insculpta TaxID=44489 RepID=UPI003EB6FD05